MMCGDTGTVLTTGLVSARVGVPLSPVRRIAPDGSSPWRRPLRTAIQLLTKGTVSDRRVALAAATNLKRVRRIFVLRNHVRCFDLSKGIRVNDYLVFTPSGMLLQVSHAYNRRR